MLGGGGGCWGGGGGGGGGGGVGGQFRPEIKILKTNNTKIAFPFVFIIIVVSHCATTFALTPRLPLGDAVGSPVVQTRR